MNTTTHIRHATLAIALLPVALLCATDRPAHAQTADVDAGTFEILRDGQPVGTETFTIRRRGLGATGTILLQGRTTIAGTEIEPILETSTDWVPIEYRRTRSGDRDEIVELVTDGRRYTAITTNERGEGEREFRAGEFTVVLDAEVAFLYHAVVARTDVGVITVLHPDQGRQARFRVEVVGNEGFPLGSETIQVRRIRMSAGDDVREILVDDRNRVMRVEIPGRSWVARRLPG